MRRGTYIQLASLLGLTAAAYALYTEFKLDDNPDYEPLCNIGSWASCTKVGVLLSGARRLTPRWQVFKSSYSHILSHWGLVPKGHPLDLSLATSGNFLAPCDSGYRLTAVLQELRSTACISAIRWYPTANSR